MHPALTYLLAQAARKVHRGATLISNAGQFPNIEGADFSLSDAARRFLKGRTAVFTALCAVLGGQCFAAFAVDAICCYCADQIHFAADWVQAKSRLNCCHGLLLDMELCGRAHLLGVEDKWHATHQLDEIKREVSSMKFPLDYTDRVYALRLHVDYVRANIHTRQDTLADRKSV